MSKSDYYANNLPIKINLMKNLIFSGSSFLPFSLLPSSSSLTFTPPPVSSAPLLHALPPSPLARVYEAGCGAAPPTNCTTSGHTTKLSGMVTFKLTLLIQRLIKHNSLRSFY